MTAFSLVILSAAVVVFGSVAAALAWSQPHGQELTTVPAGLPRRKKRPF